MGGLAVPAITFMFWVVIGAIVIIQIVITSRLLNQNRRWAALGVWMVYPAAFILLFGYLAYVNFRVQLAAQDDYSSRDLPVTVENVRNILFETPAAFKSGFDGLEYCQRTCLSALKEGSLDSIAIPADGLFKIYRLNSGEACNEARKNATEIWQSERLSEQVAHDREMVWRELKSLNQRLENLPNWASGKELEQRSATIRTNIAETETKLAQAGEAGAKSKADLQAIWRKPTIRINRVRGDGELAELGYYDQCVTASFAEDYDYEIMIRSGPDLRRPHGPCCAIAEVYEKSESGPRLVARWEGSHYDHTAFTALQIVTKLTGTSFEYELPPRQSEGLEAELSMLREILDQGGYLPDWSDIRTRLMSVVGQQYRESGDARLTLRDKEIETLMRMTHGLREKGHDLRFYYFERYLDADSYARLKEADAARN